MKKWEHESDWCGSSEILKLNMERRSRDGWELVAVTPVDFKTSHCDSHNLFWNRPVKTKGS